MQVPYLSRARHMGQDGSVTTSARPGRDVPTLVARAREGDPRSVARLISLVENGDPYEFTVFEDGRAIIKGTSEPDKARTLYAKYVGH